MDKEVWEKLKSTIGHLKELDLPTTGWELSDVIDLKDDNGNCDYEDCELCGHEIRYVHVMTNEKFGVDDLRVGCVCAANMEALGKEIEYSIILDKHRQKEQLLRDRAYFMNLKFKHSGPMKLYLEYKGYTAFVVNDSFGRNNKGYYIKRKDHIVCGLKWIDEFGNKLFTELAIKKAIYSALLQLLRV